MKALICPQCNGKMEVTTEMRGERRVAVCEYCGATLLLEQEDPDQAKKRRRLEEVRRLETCGAYGQCDRLWNKILKKYSTDYKVLWEYVLYATDSLNAERIVFDTETLLKAEKYAHRAVQFAPETQADEMIEKWEAFVTVYNEKLEEMERRAEERNKENLRKVVNGDYEQLHGAYLGSYRPGKCRFVYENGKLFLDLRVRNEVYTIEGLYFSTKKIEVILTPEGFFQEVYIKRRFFKKQTCTRDMILDGERVQLTEMVDYRIKGIQYDMYQHSCTIMVGEKKYHCFY